LPIHVEVLLQLHPWFDRLGRHGMGGYAFRACFASAPARAPEAKRLAALSVGTLPAKSVGHRARDAQRRGARGSVGWCDGDRDRLTSGGRSHAWPVRIERA